MSNSFFRFKQFIVHQDQTAMKVCTDACLFGAWVVKNTKLTSAQNILDIGTGTGLLSLMLAQHCTATIDAVEIETMAAEQANANFKASKWHNQLQIHTSSIIDFAKNNQRKYDLIITNPPFFEQQLKSTSAQRNIAMHSAHLTLFELANCINILIADTGVAAILLPWNRSKEWKEIVEKLGVYCIKETTVKQSSAHPYFRTMILMQKKAIAVESDTINIKEGNEYSKEFSQLLAPYYLAL